MAGGDHCDGGGGDGLVRVVGTDLVVGGGGGDGGSLVAGAGTHSSLLHSKKASCSADRWLWSPNCSLRPVTAYTLGPVSPRLLYNKYSLAS